MPFANSREVLPADAWYLAQIVTLHHEDCGPCQQITVNWSQRSGVDAELIRSVLDGKPSCLSREMEDIFEFATSILTGSGNLDELPETLRTKYGDRGLIELSYAIAASRIELTVKRALSFAQSCRQVAIRVDEGHMSGSLRWTVGCPPRVSATLLWYDEKAVRTTLIRGESHVRLQSDGTGRPD